MDKTAKEVLSALDLEKLEAIRSHQSESLEKTASSEVMTKQAEALAEDIFAEMRKDAEFGARLRELYKFAALTGIKSTLNQLKPYAPHALAGVAGVGAVHAIGRANAANRASRDLASALSAETTADIQSEQILGQEVMRNRGAILTLARALDAAKKQKSGESAATKTSSMDLLFKEKLKQLKQ